ncbi:hypothetical protein BHE74_00024439, partial [Ensete ventricosum]
WCSQPIMTWLGATRKRKVVAMTTVKQDGKGTGKQDPKRAKGTLIVPDKEGIKDGSVGSIGKGRTAMAAMQ